MRNPATAVLLVVHWGVFPAVCPERGDFEEHADEGEETVDYVSRLDFLGDDIVD